ncbi:Na/Pi cotransporter family protein [Bradyrhizobium sp. WSM 1738]|uniref:Na/Pi cotransporter family protein n=1 Tax=Bradyrhizobium hereditatis TaxID=2821405 RepID=UPI001CE32E7E|nr:Na/Pi symporter [Bradyrhizobium hereditatis]MCA6114867.1 Na/Pi cotransporter family protein [Bradyrhizobium hereditatis]
MATAISVLGGVGLFLLGMTVMTEGLKRVAGSALRAMLGKAAATPLHGSFWGAIVTLLVQSSSATTMTTIGLVSAGLLTFPQGLGLVFGANVGTTGTGWLVALIGVRVSLTAAALPMIFIGALTKLLARGRMSGAGAALAGFGLVLFGLTTLQQGMGGLAERLHPADLPAVLGGPEARWWSGLFGVLALVAIGLVMTALMQSSTAAVAVTLSGHYAGAIGLDQACALIIGQNIGTATSSALAAIGASTTAKRLAIAYVLFKLVAAVIALVLFPVVIPLLLRAASTVDGVTLLAAYHTAYNVVGVVVLLPLVNRFTQLIERILPERGSPLTRCLEPLALASPIVAVEAVRRTIARVLITVCGSVEAALTGRAKQIRLGKDAVSVQEAADALRQAQLFLSDMTGPPDTDEEQRRLTSTLHALDRASRLTEVANGGINFASVGDGPEDIRAGELCAEAMRSAAAIARGVAAPPRVAGSPQIVPASRGDDAMSGPRAIPPDEAIAELERCTKQLDEALRTHRSATLGAVANGTLTADAALLRVETVRNLEALSQHAWRSAAHLVGRG